MSYLEIIGAEFDEDNRILHLSAKEKIIVKTQTELNTLCSNVHTVLEKYCSDDRCYMIVDLAVFSIEPILAESYGKKIMAIAQKFLYSKGLVRYGYQITRMTVQMSSSMQDIGDPLLFHNRDEAEKYMFSLIEKRKTVSNNPAQ